MVDHPLTSLGIDASAPHSLFEQVCTGLRQRIVTGDLSPGTGCRHPVAWPRNWGVAIDGGRRLRSVDGGGLVEGRSGSGTYVSRIGEIELPDAQPVRASSQPLSGDRVPRPFHPGQPDMRLFPVRQWASCFGRLARVEPEALIAGGDPFGDHELRTRICRYLVSGAGSMHPSCRSSLRRDLATPRNVLSRVSGSTDRVALENPCYPPLRSIAAGTGLEVEWLAIDRDGAVPPGGHLKAMAVLTPSSQFPLGGTMPRARRAEFLNWATQEGAGSSRTTTTASFAMPAAGAGDGGSRPQRPRCLCGQLFQDFLRRLAHGVHGCPGSTCGQVRADHRAVRTQGVCGAATRTGRLHR